MNTVVTRFAPSPTGYFHAGSYRTALFAWIFAKKNNGRFILRIEDTDKERSKDEYEENIIDSLKWLGLNYDAFYRQSERTEIYKKYIGQLIDSGHAYVSKEEEKNSEHADKKATFVKPIRSIVDKRSEVIRFKNPNKKVVFDDLIRGRVEFDTTELGDFVIAKSEDEPVFHLVNVIDDLEMGMTHIIRGEDHISNTPRQILIYEALGAVPPKYAHIPLLLAKDRSKLSKRNGAMPITDYRNRGYLPRAIVNYLALLGWHPADNNEILSEDDMIRDFTLERVQKSGAIFDDDKLLWFNRQYMMKLSDEEFVEQAKPFLPEWLLSSSDLLKRMLSLIRDKVHAFGDITKLFEDGGELSFIKTIPKYNTDLLLWRKDPDREHARRHLLKVVELFGEQDGEKLNTDSIKGILANYAESEGKGNVLWPLRVALTGLEKSPDPFVSFYILGKGESLSRINQAITNLSK